MLFTKKAGEVLKKFKEIISEAGRPEFLVTGNTLFEYHPGIHMRAPCQ